MNRQSLRLFVQQFDCLSPFELYNLSALFALNCRDIYKTPTLHVSNLKVGMVAAALVHTIRLIIDKQPSTEFFIQFSYMTPFDLKHLSQTLVNCYEQMQDADGGQDMEVTSETMLVALTDAMRIIRLELAKDRIEEVYHYFEEARRVTYTPRPVGNPGADNIVPFKKKCMESDIV
ncbi:MAG: hypothetical protein ACK5UY_04755 [Holosporales bacterium]